MTIDIVEYNRRAWNREVERGNRWTVPVTDDVIARARGGEISIVLTPSRPIPRDWFPASLGGVDILCLASGGGQQGPVLAAAGARVTVFDNSDAQLRQDEAVAARCGLELTTVRGDMADLSAFSDASFDVIVHPVSNCFVPDVRPVWREAYRVLRSGGALLAGFMNPAIYIFEDPWEATPNLSVRYALPYDERTSISEAKRQGYVDKEEPLIFSHTLDSQIGGQLAASFVLVGLYEDRGGDHGLSKFMPMSMATRALKP